MAILVEIHERNNRVLRRLKNIGRPKVFIMSPPHSGGNLGGGGGGGGRTFRKIDEFSEILTKSGLKTVFSSANGGVCRKFESFVGNLGGFAPPPPEKANFRHCLHMQG